ncbi:YcaO-like family protein [Vibrio vulnificus]|uniref:YcaO-like family protein n=1 Tax=Vibrio vulnificus TaxID=672 RepID=UPI0025547633|nr:YcaO-like family protein [Vibrio vulnificus]WIL74409.1 YcaO-like family protein [Vibrio vulnificus]
MSEYELRLTDNPINSKLPDIFSIKCLVAHGIAVGSGDSESQREISAIGEAIEWDTMFSLQEDLYQPFDKSNLLMLPPEKFGHQNVEGLAIDWVCTENVKTGEALVHRPTRLVEHNSLYKHTSNGVAVHATQKKANASALNEIIERTSISLFWSGRLSIHCLGDVYSDFYLEALAALGWKVEFYSLYRRPVVVMALITNEFCYDYPLQSIITGFKCADSIGAAAKGAFYEAVQVIEALYLGAGMEYLTHEQRFFFTLEGVRLMRRKIRHRVDHKPTIVPKDSDIYFRNKESMGFHYSECFVSGLPINYEKSRMEAAGIWPL